MRYFGCLLRYAPSILEILATPLVFGKHVQHTRLKRMGTHPEFSLQWPITLST